MTKKLVFGVGINDSNYVVNPTVNGQVKKCKIYQTWLEMLRRCYSSEYIQKHPTYVGCSVSEEGLSFMGFRAWMLQQDYEGKQLDKDLLIKGNKIYAKDTCVFISKTLNTFTIERTTPIGSLPIGVCLDRGKFKASCSNPFTKTRKHLGRFETPKEAHLAWKQYKHELALEYAKLETDPRVIEALQNRYK